MLIFLAFNYSALLLLSLSVRRHAPLLFDDGPSPSVRFGLRLVATALLLLTLLLAIYLQGPVYGPVSSLVTAGVAGTVLIYLLVFLPQPALWLGVLLPLLGGGLSLLSI